MRQVPFQVDLTPTDPAALACECVTSSPQQISASVHAFLHGTASIPRRSTAAAARSVGSKRAVARLPLTPIGESGLTQARHAAQRLQFPYEYPRVQDRGGSAIPVSLRNYIIHAPGRVRYPIYVAVFSAARLGQYYDVQGTTWTRAPLLRNPQQTVRIGGRSYELFYSGQHLDVVAWLEHGAAYWVRNTLNDSMPNGELLAIAEQTEPLAVAQAAGSGATGSRVSLKAAAHPRRVASPAQRTDVTQSLGLLGAVVGVILLPFLLVVWVRRRREIRRIRARFDAGTRRQSELLAALGTPAAPGDH